MNKCRYMFDGAAVVRVGVILTLLSAWGNDMLMGSTILQVHDRPSAEEGAGVLATPQEKRGPQLDLDNDNNPIITFKAEHKGCQAYAIAPSSEAVKDGIKVYVVYNNRLPMNHKWKKDSKIWHEFAFKGPVEIYYDDAGTTGSHGGAMYLDTNHNWGIRLVKGDVPIKKEADYLRYIRHGYSTTVPFDISKLTLAEAEHLIKRGAFTAAFEQEILEPLKQKIANNESWSGTHEGFRLVMISDGGDQEYGIEGSLDEYLSNKTDCSQKSFTQSDGWTFIQLKK